ADLCPLPVAAPLPRVLLLMVERLSPESDLGGGRKNKKTAPDTEEVRQRDQRCLVVLASLRWYYPGQVLRVVRLGGLSAVWPRFRRRRIVRFGSFMRVGVLGLSCRTDRTIEG